MILGIAPKESEAHRKTLLKQSKTITLVFLMVCALPVVIYLLFYFGLIAAKARFDLALEQPVALVNTGTSTGSAFLVGETRLLTAKHVVDQLNVGDPVVNFRESQTTDCDPGEDPLDRSHQQGRAGEFSQ